MMPFVAVLAMNPCEYSRRRRGNRGNISPMKTLREMLAEARQVVPEEGPEDLQRRLKSDAPPAVIDVRDPDEYRDGRSEERRVGKGWGVRWWRRRKCRNSIAMHGA